MRFLQNIDNNRNTKGYIEKCFLHTSIREERLQVVTAPLILIFKN